jgi:ATP-binding cassette subfamily B (MDR/TAP) protein 7
VAFQSLLAFYMCYQKTLGEASEWSAYLNALPKSYSNPYFCTDVESFQLPDSMHQAVHKQKTIIAGSFTELLELLKDDQKHIVDFESFEWAYFTCSTRCFFVDSAILKPLCGSFFKRVLEDQPNSAMVPYFDFFNHSDVGTRAELSTTARVVARNRETIRNGEMSLRYQLFTDTPFNKNEQIFINYGTFNNTKLLLEYGFYIPGNHKDFIEFTYEDIKHYLQTQSELKFLTIQKEKDIFIEDNHLDRNLTANLVDGLSQNFLTILAILLAEEDSNLAEIAFSENFYYRKIQRFAVDFLNRQHFEYQNLSNSLRNLMFLSESGEMCAAYFDECSRMIEKALQRLCWEFEELY